MTRTGVGPSLQIATMGAVSQTDVDYAEQKVEHVLARVGRPVLYARLRLTHAGDPAVSRPALAQVNVDVDGRLVRAQVGAATMHEAADLVQARLADKLARAARNWESLRGARPVAEPGEWRHQNIPAQRPEYFPRPPAERRIIRHKAFAVAQETVDEAAFDMELADYHFFLFTDAATGADCLLDRGGPESYRVTSTRAARFKPTGCAVPVAVCPDRPPRLMAAAAARRLALTGAAYLFFIDRGTGRGNVVYHRYDGHYGLITPVR